MEEPQVGPALPDQPLVRVEDQEGPEEEAEEKCDGVDVGGGESAVDEDAAEKAPKINMEIQCLFGDTMVKRFKTS